jgi:hypothetical protein
MSHPKMLHIVTSLDALAAKQREVEAHEREAEKQAADAKDLAARAFTDVIDRTLGEIADTIGKAGKGHSATVTGRAPTYVLQISQVGSRPSDIECTFRLTELGVDFSWIREETSGQPSGKESRVASAIDPEWVIGCVQKAVDGHAP